MKPQPLNRKIVNEQILGQIDRVWSGLVGQLLDSLNSVYGNPHDDRHVATEYRLFDQRIVEAMAKLDALRSLVIYLDLDLSHGTDKAINRMKDQIHRHFRLELIRQVLFYDFAGECIDHYAKGFEEAA